MSRDYLPPRPGERFQPGARRDRESANSSGPFLRALLVGALALSVALLIVAVSARQVSQPGNAMPLLQAMVLALTDPEPLVASQLESIRSRANSNGDDGIEVTGFPLPVRLSAQEARSLEAPSMADLLVTRAAALLYVEGMGAFDQTGSQDGGVFSAQGIVRRTGDRLTADANNSASRWSAILLVPTGILGVAVILAYREDRRLRAVGIGVLLGGFTGLLLCVALGLIADGADDGDPFGNDIRAIADDALGVAQRNFLVVSFLGVFLIGASIALRYMPRPAEPEALIGSDGE